MSPAYTPARIDIAPVNTGRMGVAATTIIATIITTTTGTGTTGSGVVSVRE
ncbi:hypothetical protein GCM10010981_15990 [Dyella nitratireducens]|uniref:Uncharacterized protein n=1 Tax=Dyella nitratireducens TaxID=1849580 RepID=A0ABQ1FRJ4_9GAMM|nr:hypothetical protein GCM10010981_15990 [Dyella nitratireducens]GLQ43336.1 hypothetical protein GCM10007902_31860 [Dyella nitratireducens]